MSTLIKGNHGNVLLLDGIILPMQYFIVVVWIILEHIQNKYMIIKKGTKR